MGKTKDSDSRIEDRVDARGYEDALILFVIRLIQLQGKRFHLEYKPPVPKIEFNDDDSIKSIEVEMTNVDTEFFVSYLSIVRQFWSQNDLVAVNRIRQILLHAAHLQDDSDLRDRIKSRDRAFRERWSNMQYTYRHSKGKFSVTFSQDELLKFWFNTVYFHTDLANLKIAVTLFQLDGAQDFSRGHFQNYLHHFVKYVQDYGADVYKILWKGLFPPGKLHDLLKMYVPLEQFKPSGSESSQ
jgi:hypothetical protein